MEGQGLRYVCTGARRGTFLHHDYMKMDRSNGASSRQFAVSKVIAVGLQYFLGISFWTWLYFVLWDHK